MEKRAYGEANVIRCVCMGQLDKLERSAHCPQFYLDYAGLTFSGWYKSFINGWFSNHITVAVVFIATCQALIAISMILKGWIFKTGAVGAIVFLLAIVPLGVGSAFPCTLILAISVWIVLRHKQIDYLWLPHSKKIPAF